MRTVIAAALLLIASQAHAYVSGFFDKGATTSGEGVLYGESFIPPGNPQQLNPNISGNSGCPGGGVACRCYYNHVSCNNLDFAFPSAGARCWYSIEGALQVSVGGAPTFIDVIVSRVMNGSVVAQTTYPVSLANGNDQTSFHFEGNYQPDLSVTPTSGESANLILDLADEQGTYLSSILWSKLDVYCWP